MDTPATNQGMWSAQDYEQAARLHQAAEAITKRLTEHAVRLAIVRHELLSFSPDARQEETTEQEIVDDITQVTMGEDPGCLDPDDQDATNCELLFVEEQIRNIFKK